MRYLFLYALLSLAHTVGAAENQATWNHSPGESFTLSIEYSSTIPGEAMPEGPNPIRLEVQVEVLENSSNGLVLGWQAANNSAREMLTALDIKMESDQVAGLQALLNHRMQLQLSDDAGDIEVINLDETLAVLKSWQQIFLNRYDPNDPYEKQFHDVLLETMAPELQLETHLQLPRLYLGLPNESHTGGSWDGGITQAEPGKLPLQANYTQRIPLDDADRIDTIEIQRLD